MCEWYCRELYSKILAWNPILLLQISYFIVLPRQRKVRYVVLQRSISYRSIPLMKARRADLKRKKPIRPAVGLILREIQSVLSKVDEKQVAELATTLARARKIVTIGAGRVGLTTKGFAMRLGHFGFNAHALGDMTVSSLKGPQDVALVASGSGETPSIAMLAEIAKKSGATVALLTANPKSRIGRIADVIVHIPAPNKASRGATRSKQPMTTLNEQCLQIFFDALVMVLMHKLGETGETMWARHSNLE